MVLNPLKALASILINILGPGLLRVFAVLENSTLLTAVDSVLCFPAIFDWLPYTAIPHSLLIGLSHGRENISSPSIKEVSSSDKLLLADSCDELSSSSSLCIKKQSLEFDVLGHILVQCIAST